MTKRTSKSRQAMPNRKHLSSFLFGILFLATIKFAAGTAEKVSINVQQEDDKIRREILVHTPLGKTADEVVDFVLSRLSYEGLYRSGVGIEPEADVTVIVGHRYDNPPFGHNAIEAHWKFDKGLRLRSIELKSLPQEGGYSPNQDPDPRPKVRIQLGHSDDMIRQAILEHTPRGSDRPRVEAFIGTRLYFQGGPINAVLLGEKRGDVVILGHYFDKASSKEMSVRVLWQTDDNGRLRDVKVSRTDSLAPILK